MDLPLSQLSTAASNSLLASMRSASLFIKIPLSVPGSSFHDGCISAALAACTAMSTSFAEPAWTSAITDSVLVMDSADKLVWKERDGNSYAGSIEAMVLPPVVGTTSPLMNRPKGCSYSCPFGVVIFLKRDMVMVMVGVSVSDRSACSTAG